MEARVARLVHNVDIGVRCHRSEELAGNFGVPVGAGDVKRKHRLRPTPVRANQLAVEQARVADIMNVATSVSSVHWQSRRKRT